MSTHDDAEEFGRHVRSGGWRLGLLVARNVERGVGNPAATRVNRRASKVSLREFARDSGTSDHRVARFLDAWERAADAGLVPHASELATGEEVTLPNPDMWSSFYDARDAGGRPRDSKATDAVLILQRRGVEAVVDAMPDAMARDLYLALARHLEHAHVVSERIPHDDSRLATGVLLMAVLAADRKVRTALSAVRTGEVDRMDTDDRERLHNLVERIRRALDLLDMAAGAGIDDAELEAWLSEGAS